ncbi:MAG: LicD family protein [Lachnospiraceae bacterium]|nr:LicD family protein [Lachnospiraceae bacterium]
MMKRSWGAQLAILSDLDEACARSGLSYCAEWGTLLGAVRHGGFIPWDDDLDICMKRSDYIRFTENVGSYLPDNYSIVNYRSNRDFKQMLSRIVSSDHYRFDAEYMKKYSGLPIALGIDIFPLDYLTDNEEYEKDRERRVRLVYDAVNEIAHFGTDPESIRDYLADIEKVCHVKLDKNRDILTQLRALLEKLFGEVDEKDAKYLTLYPIWMGNKDYVFPKEYYETVRVPFENMTIPVPAAYEAVLKKKYGTSFMNCIRSGGAHEYPYYEDHVDVLHEHFGFEWPHYRFRAEDLTAYDGRDITRPGKRAVFITYDAKAYRNMRSLAKAYIEDGFKVTILAAVKYDIASDMSGVVPAEDKEDAGYYLDGLDGAEFTRDPAIVDTHPDVIVTNYPYDEYNLITTVDKIYYSSSLKDKCDMLVYVPPFEPHRLAEGDERARKLMKEYVPTPMAVRCDEIVLHSEELCQRYIECLTAFSGERYKEVWEGKIGVLPEDTGAGQKTSREGKKKILFHVGISCFAEHQDAAIEKIRKTFKIFDDNSEKIEVIYHTWKGFADDLQRLYPDVYEEYERSHFSDRETNADDMTIGSADAYYGEASSLLLKFTQAGKPAMLWNPKV